MQTKNDLRSKMRKLRNCLSAYERHEQQRQIYSNFTINVKFAQHSKIAGYLSIDGEVNIIEILWDLEKQGHQICLPEVLKDSMIYRLWDLKQLEKNKDFPKFMGSPISFPEIIPEVVLTPLVAVDILGNRVGFGRGYYDKYIAHLRSVSKVITIGICYDFQLVSEVPYEVHDQRLDIIITDKRFIKL